MAEPFIGEIRIWANNFAPRGWAYCDGQLLAISQYQALFSILGNTFGGDARETFGVPDLRSRAPMHPGSGPGLSHRVLGQTVGQAGVTLTAQELPSHDHIQEAVTRGASQPGPANAFLARTSDLDKAYAPPDANQVALASQSVGVSGQSQPHENMQPYQAVGFTIALTGIYPPRS